MVQLAGQGGAQVDAQVPVVAVGPATGERQAKTNSRRTQVPLRGQLSALENSAGLASFSRRIHIVLFLQDLPARDTALPPLLRTLKTEAPTD